MSYNNCLYLTYSLSRIFSRSTMLLQITMFYSFCMTELYIYIYKYIYHVLLNQLSIDGHLGCFHVLTLYICSASRTLKKVNNDLIGKCENIRILEGNI